MIQTIIREIRFICFFIELPPCHQTLLSFQIKLHGQRCKHGIYHLPRLGKHINLRHKSDDLLALLRGDLQRTQAHAQIAPYFALQRKVGVAPPCHVAAHHASRAQLYLIEIALGAPGQIRAERRLQLGRGAAVDDLRRGGEGVRFHIDIPQVLAQLGHRQLQSRLHCVEVHRRGGVCRQRPYRAELPAEHHADQLGQHTVLGAENILERPGGNICFL